MWWRRVQQPRRPRPSSVGRVRRGRSWSWLCDRQVAITTSQILRLQIHPLRQAQSAGDRYRSGRKVLLISSMVYSSGVDQGGCMTEPSTAGQSSSCASANKGDMQWETKVVRGTRIRARSNEPQRTQQRSRRNRINRRKRDKSEPSSAPRNSSALSRTNSCP